jgi:orotidine-5'-phosphate decarboxylase
LSGVDGVVCSAYESFDIKNNTSKEFITLCPGIRPFGEDSGDQKRVADIPFAKENLVDFIVVGRPIYKADNPKNVVEEILKNI